MNIQNITTKELERIYTSNKTKDVCKLLKISTPTLIKYLTENNIKLKGKGTKRKLLITN